MVLIFNAIYGILVFSGMIFDSFSIFLLPGNAYYDLNMSRRVILFFLFSILNYPLIAGENCSGVPQDTIRSYAIDEVVITASRKNSIRRYTPEAIRTIGQELIGKYQMRTAPEALQLAHGVFLQKTSHGGGSPLIRGLTGNQILLLIDGIRLSNATYRYGPNQYFNTIDIFSVEKIEVLRGGGSVQYGSDALGGAVQVFTPDLNITDKPFWSGDMMTRIASQKMEQTLHANLIHSGKRSAFGGGVTWRNFGDIYGGDTTGIQSPTGYHEMDFDVKGKVNLSSSAELTLAFQNMHQFDVPVYHKVNLEDYLIYSMDPQKRQLGYIRLEKRLDAGIIRTVKFTTSLQHTEEGRKSQKDGSESLLRENDKVRSLAFIAEIFTGAGHRWSASNGFEIYHDLVNSSRTDYNLQTGKGKNVRGLYPDGSTMTSLAAYTLNTIDLSSWIFTAGLRFSTFIINVEDETIGKAKLRPSSLVGDLAVLRKLTGKSTLFVSASSGFRVPNIDDLGTLGIVDFRYEIPNYALRPENSFQYQAGYKFQGNKLEGEIYLYRNLLRNLIVRTSIPGDTIDGYAVYMKENTDRAYIQGVETNIGVELNSAWQINGSLMCTYGRNITKDEPMRRIPPIFGRLALEYSSEMWWGSIVWMAAAKQERLSSGDRSDNRIPEDGTPGWNIFNISAGYGIKHFKADLSLENLFNKDYRYHGSGINGYGRFIVISLIFKI